MSSASFPFYFYQSTSAREVLGRHAAQVAALALRAILRRSHSLAVAHQQIEYRGVCIAFSSRVTGEGGIVVELDLGDPRLADRIVLEDDLRQATQRARRGITRDR